MKFPLPSVSPAESDALLRVMMDSSPALLWMTDTVGRCIHLSKSVLELTGRTPLEHLGDGWHRNVHADDLPLVIAAFARHAEVGKPFQMDFRLRRHTGEYTWLHDDVRPWHLPDGTLGGFVHTGLKMRRLSQAEHALHDVQLRIQAFLDTDAAIVFMMDAEERYQLVNRAWRVAFHKPDDPVVGQTFDELFPPPLLAESREDNRAVLRRGEHIRREMDIVVEGETRTFTVNKLPVRDDNGTVVALVGVAVDITERTRAELALAESERRLQNILDSMNVVVNLTDREGRYVFVNRRFREVFQEEGQNILGREFSKVFDPAMTPGVKEYNEAAWAAETPMQRDFKTLRPDGRELHFRVQKFALRDATGAPSLLCTVAMDITDRVVAEQERAASERLLHDILDSMNVSVSLNDREQRFLFMNKQYREFFMDPDGPKAPDGQLALSDIYAADRARTVTELNRKVWDTGEEFLEDRVVTAPDGHENVYRVQKFLLRDEKHAPYAVCSVATDITDRVRAEEERLRIEQKLQQQQRLESLGALAGGIAHDFNNLLVGMLGNAGLALEELPEDSPAHDALVHIESAATRASELTRQMLALSGHGRFHVEPIDLSTLARDTVPLVRSTVPNQTTLRLDLAPGLPAVDADATQLHHVVTNLLLNAAEAMAGHTGAITLRTGTLDLDRDALREYVNGDAIEPGQYVFLEIADEGVGMDTETLDRIFDPFFSTKFVGRGLGLPTALGIVRSHRGAMRVDSAPGLGSRFMLIFPTSTGAPRTQSAAVPRPIENGERGGVLVVDDNDSVRRVVRRAMEHQGYHVLVADGGHEAEELLREHGAEVRLALVDLTMPGLGGIETVQRLIGIQPALSVVLMSGYSAEDVTSTFEGHMAGIHGFLQKPFRVQDLLEVVRDTIDRHTH